MPPASHRRRQGAARTACWASVLAVLWLWVTGGGLVWGSSAAALTSLGRLAGLLGADLLLVQVLLMARVPWVEQAFGQDELARRHRLVGFWSVSLVLLHLVLITLGYAGSAGHGALAELWLLVTTYDGMVMAATATAFLVLVGVTSVRLARRRLRYETWHLLHLYAYLGVGLSVPHEIWTGADLASSPLARSYWVGAYLLSAGALVVFRLAVPAWRSLRHGLVVAAVEEEAPGVVSVRVTGRQLARLGARAGQFFVWRFRDGPGWTAGHPYSLSAAPGHELRFTVKAVGDATSELAALRVGTPVLVEGPYGRLTAQQQLTDRAVLLGCGIGITPLRALLEELHGVPTTLVYRARSRGELVLREEIEALAARQGAEVHYLLGGRRSRSWLPAAAPAGDVEVLRRLVPQLTRSDLYVCGPPGWTDAVVRAARAAGVPREQVHVERFGW